MRCKQWGKGAWKFPASMAMANYETVLKWRIFFLFGPRLFLRTFGVQINWRVTSRKVLFAPNLFLSNKSPILFAGASGNGNTFFSGKWHSQNEMDIDRHGPRLMPNNCKNLNPPFFSLLTTLDRRHIKTVTFCWSTFTGCHRSFQTFTNKERCSIAEHAQYSFPPKILSSAPSPL